MSIQSFKYIWVGLLLALLSPVPLASAQVNVESGKIGSVREQIYYSIRPDLRKCVSPLCGGYWISAVNQKSTRCAGGRQQAECYVAKINWAAIGLDGSEGASLVLGHQRQSEFSSFGSLGVLTPGDAWRPATDAPPEGTWFGLRDNGMRCITSPCYSIDERTLNGRQLQTISDVDLSGVAALEALVEDELLAVGENVVVPDAGPAGDGLTMVASQFFLRVTAKASVGLYCKTDADCTLSTYHSFVSSSEDCYCPLCPTPLNAEAAKANEESWDQYCSGFGFSASGDATTLICPMVRCIAPSPVACIDNQCMFTEGEDPLPLESLPQ